MNTRATVSSASEESGVVSVVLYARGKAELAASDPRLFLSPRSTPMNRQLLEIRSEIDDLLLQMETVSKKLLTLRILENSLIQQQLPPNEREQTVLVFDDDTRTISWASGTIKLATLRYRLVKTLWKQPAHKAELIILENKVWDETGEITVPTTTIRSMINRTNSEIQQQRFPYKICSVKNTENQLCGYELR